VTGPAPSGERRPRTSDFLTELFRTPLDPGYAQAARRRTQGAPEPAGWRRGTALGIRVCALGVLGYLEAGAGLAKVRGAGIVVRLVDAPPPVDPVTGKQTGNNPGRVLDRDLQDIANELWRRGAEAIAINGERLTATATIRAAGDAILVDFRPVTAPYEVSAIGPGDLAGTFGGSATAKRFRKYADVYRMEFSVKQRDGITLPAAAEARLRYAHQPPDTPSPSGSQRPSGSPVPSASGGRR
jgi:hypothetical protein